MDSGGTARATVVGINPTRRGEDLAHDVRHDARH